MRERQIPSQARTCKRSGLPTTSQTSPACKRLIPILHGDVGGISNGGGDVNAYLANQQPEWDFGDSLTINHGRHTITTGLDYRNYKLNRNYNQNFLGLFTFSGFATGGSTPTVQSEVADFLLGYFYKGGNAYVPGPAVEHHNARCGGKSHFAGLFLHGSLYPG